MTNVNDIRICGIDESRPPKMKGEPYINLYFKLSEKAPEAWCNDFNQSGTEMKFNSKINSSEGLVIETWVRTIPEIEPWLETLKASVEKCNTEYIARLEKAELAAAAVANAANKNLSTEDSAQSQLDRVVTGLKFD